MKPIKKYLEYLWHEWHWPLEFAVFWIALCTIVICGVWAFFAIFLGW